MPWSFGNRPRAPDRLRPFNDRSENQTAIGMTWVFAASSVWSASSCGPNLETLGYGSSCGTCGAPAQVDHALRTAGDQVWTFFHRPTHLPAIATSTCVARRK